MTPPLGQKPALRNQLMKVKEESEKAGLKLNIQKAKIMTPGPITSWQVDGEKMEFGQLNSLFDLLNDGCTAFLLVQSLLMKVKD